MSGFPSGLRKNKEIGPFASNQKAARDPRGFFDFNGGRFGNAVRGQFVATFALFLS
ncbi:hypothetical protein [Mesorhizobium sp. CA16]|uniref:hypothetical protein n=1 Tax=Mesorhizobium sp. CA16 TaxID=588496 RepID=UPI001CCB4C65|nr:hypothetical protein [Mesorhizobium sp. CA16]MBZ9915523.1 hypothetical protein [Mesorhizobium sp. CA16]